jgi:ectoine hydroxylase-related dioxygenase (phytanoyl-CoA dioxygenase family)
MNRLTGWLKWRLRQATYRNPWPQPESCGPWLDRSTALAQIRSRWRRGEIDASTAKGLKHWHRYGYLILPRVIDEVRIERVLADFERFWLEQTIVGGQRRPVQKDPLGHFQPTINVHMQSDAVKDVMLDPTILHWLSLILGRPVYGCQCINFFAGSRRGLHQDHVHLTTRPYGFLAAAWIALEDIDPRWGPMLYVPGSHWLHFIGEPALTAETAPGQDANATLATLLAADVDRFGLQPKPFLARRGDVLLWHCNLIHGGAPVVEPSRSRLSIACHYAAFGVDYYHELSGFTRDPSDVLYHKGAPYLPEYYDANGDFAPTLQTLLRRASPQPAHPAPATPVS